MDKLNAAELLTPPCDSDREGRLKALFTNLFIQQNRIQTAFEKIEPDISLKQWMLLGITESCPEPKTLTRVGQLMGCSRQNVKQLADSLAKKGYLSIAKGGSRSVCLELTEDGKHRYEEIYGTRKEFLEQLYCIFNDKEIEKLYSLQSRIFDGIEFAEKYASENQKKA